MAFISNQSTFTVANFKKITTAHISTVFLMLALILPFFLFKRALPQTGFYSELTASFLFCLFIFFANFSLRPNQLSSLKQKTISDLATNKVAAFFLAIGAYLIFDMLVNPPVYPSLHVLYIGTFVLAALLSNTIVTINKVAQVRLNPSTLGNKHSLMVLICFGLMAGALIQDAVVIAQILHTDLFAGIVEFSAQGGDYAGNIGQRNMLGVYLTLGLLATAYLQQVKKIAHATGWVLIVLQVVILGAANSRALVIYLICMLIVLGIAAVWQPQIGKHFIRRLALIIGLALLFQMLTLPIIHLLLPANVPTDTSIERLGQVASMTPRITEWHKAWLIFCDNPWFGTGWNSYSYQGFIKTLDPRVAYAPPTSQLFIHTHSLLFNFLAEIGAVGTSFILGLFAWVLSPLLKKTWQPQTLIVLLMLTAFLVHNMVEFSLWYTYFFLIFAALLTLLLTSFTATEQSSALINPLINPSEITPTHSDSVTAIYAKSPTLAVKKIDKTSPLPNLEGRARSILALVLAALSIHLYVSFYQLDRLNYRIITDNTDQQRMQTAQRMLDIGKQQPLIKAYVDMQAASYLQGVSMDEAPASFSKPLYDSAHYQPLPMSGINYLAQQCQQGDWNEQQWQFYRQLVGYFPTQVPNFSIIMSMNKKCDKAFAKVYEECIVYQRQHNETHSSCEARNMSKPDLSS